MQEVVVSFAEKLVLPLLLGGIPRLSVPLQEEQNSARLIREAPPKDGTQKALHPFDDIPHLGHPVPR